MKKLYFSLVALALAGGTILAQAKLDIASRTFLRGKAAIEAQSRLKSANHVAEDSHAVIIRLADGQDASELENAGIDVSYVIADKFVVTTVNRSQLTAVEGMKSVASVSSSRKKHFHNDNARIATNVDKVQAGTGLEQAYKGDGVIVGIVDGGFDPNHIAFYNDDQTASRVDQVITYTVNSNTGAVSKTTVLEGDDIASFTSDDTNESHGTHTSATVAGAYVGSSFDYHGMAPHANIVMCGGDLSDAAILKSVTDIKAHADEVSKPFVINMSLGDNYGPHDGTDDFTAALNELAKDIPICVSAGNEADLNVAIVKELTESDTQLKTALVGNDYLKYYYSSYQAAGMAVIYGADDSDFDVQFAIISKSTGEILYSFKATSSIQYVASGTAVETGDMTDTNFTTNFPNSFFGMYKAIDSNNGRRMVEMQFELKKKSSFANPTVHPAIIINGKAGQKIFAYADNQLCEFTADAGYDKPTTDGTISNMACGKNTISVGAYNTKNVSPYTGRTIGDIADYSSWGRLADGRLLPTICAPGAALVSAMSYYFTQSSYYDATYYPKTAKASVNGKTHYFTPMEGTSMAAPMMTGIAALWIQANPKLTPAEIAEIAQSTAVKPANYTDQWGPAGKVDAYAGLKKALEMAGVTEILADGNASVLINEIADRKFEVYAVDADGFNAAIYNMAGQKVSSATTADDTATLDATNLSSGMYVIKVAGKSVSHSQKVVIR
ncbi:MAG: S8 family peptidase [Muribaculaceae bacterium]